MPDQEFNAMPGYPAPPVADTGTRSIPVNGESPVSQMLGTFTSRGNRAELRTFDNRDTPPRYRFEAFRHFYASIGDPTQYMLHRLAPEQFYAEATVLQGVTTNLHRYRIPPLRNVFTEARAKMYGTSYLWLLGQNSGSGILTARGRAQSLGPLSLSLLCIDEPFATTLQKPSNAVAVGVPFDRLSLRQDRIRQLAFSVLPARRLLLTLLIPTVRALMDPYGPGLDRDGVDQCLAGLADLVIRTADGLEPDHIDTHDARRLQIERYIREHLAEPGLCAHSIAMELRISVRLVHKLFQGQPETLHDLIQRQRVEHAERLLAAHPELRLDGIADRTGFGSTKTLVRAFHRLYGETPYQHNRGEGTTCQDGSSTITASPNEAAWGDSVQNSRA